MRTYDPTAGSRIDDACAELVALAKRHGEPVEMSFNDTRVVAEPNDDAETLVSRWGTERDLRFQNWGNSPEGIAEAQRRREDIERRQTAVDTLIRRWETIHPLASRITTALARSPTGSTRLSASASTSLGRR